MDDLLIRAQWRTSNRGAGFVPAGDAARAACSRLTDREVVVLEVRRARSGRSHRHQFAEIHDAWLQLPERLQGMPWAANPEVFRKHLLVVTGYSDVRTVVASSKAEATRLAALLTHLATEAHGYALADVRGNVVTLRTPWSQSCRAMGREVFQQSKTAILEAAAQLLEVEVEALREHGEQA